ncbi:MAG: Na(+)/H(+) antiporter NhaD [Bacteroidetes bacterium ADurb.Bin416]|nr:MAG: Na(+)/H(+) antiporter NhaD [Bacteroidetes bacterium ADurb.Bin416]
MFAGIIIIAANSGGAFSPIGDVTTIMLWINGNVTTGGIIPELLLPAIISMLVPTFLVSLSLKGDTKKMNSEESASHNHPAATIISQGERYLLFFLGVGSLIFVPIFKSITHLPPFIGVLFGLSILWIVTEILYKHKHQVDESRKARITHILSRIDTSTILFFLGILMAVAALQEVGILRGFSQFLDKEVGNYYIINIIIGILSSVVDNVPLVAGAMGMYTIDPSSLYFAQDGIFWIFLAYCAGVGGSILIIGSAAGVVVMGLEKINFIWYLKKISWVALLGYLAGAGVYILEMTYLFPAPQLP